MNERIFSNFEEKCPTNYYLIAILALDKIIFIQCNALHVVLPTITSYVFKYCLHILTNFQLDYIK